MTTAAIIASVMLALSALGFSAAAAWFLNKSRATTSTVRPDNSWPKAAVFLALRKPDPYLDECLRSLMHQDYPDYDLHIVVDSEQDPAWGIVKRLIQDKSGANVRAALLRDPLLTCSLKCSALLQMLQDIDSDVEVIALIDGDVVPHRAWLRQLVAPLADPGVGASFGVPWYFPAKSNWASVARKVCWAPAAILMALCGWIWGGTTALSSRVFRDPALAERWSRSVSSDASIRDVIKACNLRLQWVPELVMPNLEPSGFESLIGQLSRSLATSRLYLNRWPLTLLAVGFAFGSLLLALLVCVASGLATNATGTFISAAGLGAYCLILMLLLLTVERRALEITSDNGADIPPPSFRVLVRMLITIPLAHALYLTSALKAHNVRSLTWRGVRYAIHGKFDVKRERRAPFPNPWPRADHVSAKEHAGTEIHPLPTNYSPARSGDYRHILLQGNGNKAHQARRRALVRSELAREPPED